MTKIKDFFLVLKGMHIYKHHKRKEKREEKRKKEKAD